MPELFMSIDFKMVVDKGKMRVLFIMDGNKPKQILLYDHQGFKHDVPLGEGRDAHKPCMAHVKRIVAEHLRGAATCPS